jgi:hypothetical protein
MSFAKFVSGARFPGWPDWANFRLLGKSFTLSSFREKYSSQFYDRELQRQRCKFLQRHG